jgi:cytochrome b subunit of formate dehydrogenase
MERAYNNTPTRVILTVLTGLVLMILGIYLFSFAGFMQNPSIQGIQTLQTLLISYGVIICIFIVIVIAYNEIVFKKVNRGTIKKDYDNVGFEKLQSKIIKELEESTQNKREDHDKN